MTTLSEILFGFDKEGRAAIFKQNDNGWSVQFLWSPTFKDELGEIMSQTSTTGRIGGDTFSCTCPLEAKTILEAIQELRRFVPLYEGRFPELRYEIENQRKLAILGTTDSAFIGFYSPKGDKIPLEKLNPKQKAYITRLGAWKGREDIMPNGRLIFLQFREGLITTEEQQLKVFDELAALYDSTSPAA